MMYIISIITNLPIISYCLIFLSVFLIVKLLLTPSPHLHPLPPGPYGIPFFGFLPFLGHNFHHTLTRLSKWYGPIYQIYLGTNRIVIINDHQIIREAFRRPEFSGRPSTQLKEIIQGYGIVNSDGALWSEQRAFLQKVLRQFGAKTLFSGENGIESKINIQIERFMHDLEALGSEPFRIRPYIAKAIGNIVGSLIMSLTTTNEKDDGFGRLLQLVDEGFKLVTIAMPVNFIPILRYVPGINYTYQKIKKNRDETVMYFKDITDKHKETIEPNHIRDICDVYLIQQEKIALDGKKSYFSEQQLVQIMIDLFSAGLETVTSSLEWAILFLILNPNVQKNVQKEIEEIIGTQRAPSLEDLPNMPYTEATIYEVLRRSNVIPLGPAHSTLQETSLGGYRIPKGTHVIPNLYAIHMDPHLWSDPDRFEPERFLKDGKIHRPNFFIPFSTGRRMCLGDILTKMELFLFLSNVLQRYNLEFPLKESVPCEGKIAASIVPNPYKVCLTLRS